MYFRGQPNLQVESNNVGFLDIYDSRDGVTVLIYVLVDPDDVLDGDSLLASIQVEPNLKM